MDRVSTGCMLVTKVFSQPGSPKGLSRAVDDLRPRKRVEPVEKKTTTTRERAWRKAREEPGRRKAGQPCWKLLVADRGRV